MEDFKPPHSLRPLSLPSSKHFCMSEIEVENFEVPKVTEEDALDLRWHLEPAQMKQVQDDVINAMPRAKSLDVICARWSLGVGGLQLYSPIFPIVEARNGRQWYGEVLELLAEVSLANMAGDIDTPKAGGLYNDMYNDMGAYDTGLLDEFDPPHFPPEPESESSGRSGATEHSDTSSTESKKPWQAQPQLVFLTPVSHEPPPEPDMPSPFGPTDMKAELEPIDDKSASSRDTAGYIAAVFSQDHLPMWNDLDSTLSQSLSQSQPLLKTAEEMERYIDYDLYAHEPVKEQELPGSGPALVLEPSQDESSISKAYANYQDTLGRHHATVANRAHATNRVYHAARRAGATVATSSTTSPNLPPITTPPIPHRGPSATGSEWYEMCLKPRSPNTKMATMATTPSPGRRSESAHAASVASDQLMVDQSFALAGNMQLQPLRRRSPYQPLTSTYTPTGSGTQQSQAPSQVEADFDGVSWHASWVRDANDTPTPTPQAAKSKPVWATEPTAPQPMSRAASSPARKSYKIVVESSLGMSSPLRGPFWRTT